MDAKERLRAYLEQRRELGESEFLLDGLSVEEAMRALGAIGRGATVPTAARPRPAAPAQAAPPPAAPQTPAQAPAEPPRAQEPREQEPRAQPAPSARPEPD